MECAKCGKEMESKKGYSVQGMQISLHKSSDKDECEFMQKQLGKYQMGKEYHFCLECVLDQFLKP